MLKLAACSIPFAFSTVARGQGDDPRPPAPAVSLERGAYAEEYERDLDQALEHYELARVVAEAMGDAAQAEVAKAAIERVRRRQGETPSPEEAEALIEQIELRIGEVLHGLQIYQAHDRHHRYETTGRELAVFGDAATEVLGELFDGAYHEVGDSTVRLLAVDIANVLAAMGTAEADAAMSLQSRSPNPLVRREIVEVSDPERHRALLLAAAADPVEAVRSAAIKVLVKAPRPEDAELLRAALREGEDAAVLGLYALDSEAVIAIALAPGASANLRKNVAYHVLEDARGAPSAAGGRLVVQLALDPQERWKDARTTLEKRLRESWALPEDVRAAMEAEALARFAEWPAAPAVRLLGMVGGLPSLRALGARLREQGALPEDDNDALWSIVARTPSARMPELARTLNEFPAQPWRYSITGGLAKLRWDAEGADLLAFWSALDEQHRSLLVRALAEWFERGYEQRKQLAGGDWELALRPGSLAPELLPLARELVRVPDEGYIRQGMFALQAIGAVEGLREALAFSGMPQNTRASQSARTAAVAIVGADPVGARDVIVAALLEDWRLRPEAPPLGPRVLELLPDSQAVEAFARLWPRAEAGSELQEALYTRLFRVEGRPEATALLVEHYEAIPPGKANLRSLVLKRVGDELYEPGIELLESALRDTDDEVRARAFSAFKSFQVYREQLAEFEAWKSGADAQRDAGAELMELLASENRSVQIGAVEALGALRAKEALPALVRMLESTDAELQNAIRVAIARMSD